MFKRSIACALALACLSAGPAAALSCMPPDIVRSYEYALKQDEIYFLLKGKIELVKDQEMPDHRGHMSQGDPDEALLEPVYGSFTGEIFNKGEFVPFDQTLEVRLNCIGPWCGQYPDEEEALYFVTAAESNLWFMLEMPACGGTRFPISEAERFISHLKSTGALSGEDEMDAGMTDDPAEEGGAPAIED